MNKRVIDLGIIGATRITLQRPRTGSSPGSLHPTVPKNPFPAMKKPERRRAKNLEKAFARLKGQDLAAIADTAQYARDLSAQMGLPPDQAQSVATQAKTPSFTGSQALGAGLAGLSAGIQAGQATADGTQGALQGALSGAAQGATFGPWGAAVGAATGLLAGNITGTSAYNAQVAENNAKIDQAIKQAEEERQRRRVASNELVRQRGQLREVVSQNLGVLAQDQQQAENEALAGTVFRGFSADVDDSAEAVGAVAQGHIATAVREQELNEQGLARQKAALDDESDIEKIIKQLESQKMRRKKNQLQKGIDTLRGK